MDVGKILWEESLTQLEQDGAGLKKLISAAYRDSGIKTQEEPIVVSCWSSILRLPLTEQSRALPLVIVGLPDSFAHSFQELLTARMYTCHTVASSPCKHRTSALGFDGGRNTLLLSGEDLLPSLRMIATGSIIFVFICGDRVAMVEQYFDRRRFLNFCAALAEDMHINESGDGQYPDHDWTPKRLEISAKGWKTWTPQVFMVDADEEFFYGVLRSAISGND
jgi:hypothetical protein